MSDKKLKVGDTLFVVRSSRKVNTNTETCYAEIIKVGNKYLTINTLFNSFDVEYQLYKDSLMEKANYTSQIKVYSCQQNYLDELETSTFIKKLRAFFSQYGLGTEISLDKLRKIDAILFPAQEED
jgi:hypothetical protein